MKTPKLLLAGLLLLFAGCGRNGDTVGGSGLIEAEEVIVAAETSGRLIAVGFDEGNRVAAGDTLAIIDPSRIELQIASAEAGKRVAAERLAAARIEVDRARQAEAYTAAELERARRLAASATASRKQLDAVEFEHDQAVTGLAAAETGVAALAAEIAKIDADIAILRRQWADCFVASPLAGMVIERYLEPGELVTPGRPVARIARLDTVWAEVYVPHGSLTRIKPGDTALVDTETGDEKLTGRVARIADEAEFTPRNVQTEESRSGLVYAIKVRIANAEGKLKIGMPVYVSFGKP
jgi:HlyD family secretion protein